MHVDVNGTRLWFDVEGARLVPEGSRMREQPCLVLIHGGPGTYDHSYFKPHFSRLSGAAQIVYLDLRGHGRSEWGDPADWSYETCADDVRAFCDTVGIDRPVVLGHSLGGAVVLVYGTRHPGHAAGLVVQSGFARFDVPRLVGAFRRLGGDEVAELARRSYSGTGVGTEEWARVYAVFGPHVPDDEELARRRQNVELNARGMELTRRLDLLAGLGAIEAPTLVCVGALDPVTPVTAAEEIVAALPAGKARLEVLEGAGHFPWLDVPDRYSALLGEFVTAAGAS